MKRYNVIIVYNTEESQILMCERKKEPYKGKLNLVGGKLEKNESEIEAAYRELYEETGITNKDINLVHLMNLQYIINDMELQVFVGKLNKNIKVIEEVNKLCWVNITENFFDINKFAGEGNIGHMLYQVEIYKDKIF